MKCADLYSAFQTLISMVNFRCVCDTLYNFDFYRPQTKFAKVMFLQVSVCPHGGACVVLFGGGRAWFYLGGMHGFMGGHAWFYSGGMCGFIWGACMVLFGGHAWFYLGGVCVVFSVFSDTMRYGQ